MEKQIDLNKEIKDMYEVYLNIKDFRMSDPGVLKEFYDAYARYLPKLADLDLGKIRAKEASWFREILEDEALIWKPYGEEARRKILDFFAMSSDGDARVKPSDL